MSDTHDPTETFREDDEGDESTKPLWQAKNASNAALIGKAIGNYLITGIIGRGGMGVVYEAEQEQPRRLVALKVINPGVSSEHIIRRFEHEAQILGLLQHSGIAQIYEAGTFDLGAGVQPFFAMEYVRGVPSTQYAERNILSTHARLELIVKICRAVQHAHQKGIIHRDLKPGNILVTEDGEPKVLDFGVARATDSDIHTTTLRTDVGQLIGTIPYMSPEQAGGDPTELDTRSDVYALGVLAYELLAGRLPYNVQQKMVHEALRVIQEDDPTPLSSTNRTLRGDVEIVIGKALEKEKDRRYQSAQEFASDIERYLNDEPIVARPPSASYQFRKFARRNKALVGGAAATFVVLLVGFIVATTLYLQAEEARAEAIAARDAEAEQRQIAERREAEAIAARVAEAERAEELELVVWFQVSQLAGIQPEPMGDSIRRDLIDKRRNSLARRGLDEEQIAAVVAELETSLAGINFTDVALQALDQNIFERALIAIDEQFEDQPLIRARLLQAVATILRELGQVDRAIAPQREAMEIRRSALGDMHEDTLTSIAHMAALQWLQGDLAEAVLYNSEVLAGFEELRGQEHPDTVRILNNLAVLLREQGQLAESARYHQRVLEIRRRVLGSDHEDTLVSISNLGTIAWAIGRLDDAERYMREAAAGFRRTYGDLHPSTLNALNQLGGILRTKGDLIEAEQFARLALESMRQVYGDNHVDTLIAANGMGRLLQLMGNHEEAETHFRESLLGFRHVLGDDHSYTLTAMNSLSVFLRNTGRLAEAHSLGSEVVQRAANTLGEGHWHSEVFRGQHALTLVAMGQYAEAEEASQRSYENLSNVLGRHHPQVLALVRLLIEAYEDRHEHEPDAGHDAKAAEWRAMLPALDDADAEADSNGKRETNE